MRNQEQYILILRINDDENAILGGSCGWRDADEFTECFGHCEKQVQKLQLSQTMCIEVNN